MLYKTYKPIRDIGGGIAVVAAAGSIWYCWTYSQTKPGDTISLFIIGVWTLVPPLWFFMEYWGIEHNWIKTPEVATNPDSEAAKAERKVYLESAKSYADYASKIWAAVLAVLVVLTKLH